MIFNNRGKGDRLLMGATFKHNYTQNQKPLASHHAFAQEKYLLCSFIQTVDFALLYMPNNPLFFSYRILITCIKKIKNHNHNHIYLENLGKIKGKLSHEFKTRDSYCLYRL